MALALVLAVTLCVQQYCTVQYSSSVQETPVLRVFMWGLIYIILYFIFVSVSVFVLLNLQLLELDDGSKKRIQNNAQLSLAAFKLKLDLARSSHLC